jgi:hypothetical protein
MADSERLEKLGFKEQLNGTSGVRVLIPPLCPVPAGPFIMGTKIDSDTPYFERFPDPEQFPEHEVTLPAYALGRRTDLSVGQLLGSRANQCLGGEVRRRA